MASSSRRARRNNKKNKQQSRSVSQSSTGSQSSAPTYMVEENSQGELVNKRMGVAWPEKVFQVKRYPDHSSGQSLAVSDGEDRFRTSPYEMVSIADLSEAIAAAKEARSGEKRAAGGRVSRTETRTTDSASSSPQYITLSANRYSSSEEEEEADDWDTPTAQIDSVVFNTAEELDRYRRLFRAASLARSATSLMSVKAQCLVLSVLDAFRPGQFFIYYDKPSGAEMPVAIELKIGYMTSANETYHYPIQRFESEGDAYYAVMQTDTDVKMFDSMASLVQHYHTFADGDPNKRGGLPESAAFGLPV
ncbi:hypothetical protein PRIPAC_76366 [Pristionchus pacificus]|uniref:Uncharacterized protein n=1 Tax=Pristionchus pacificus TaxID=54126 RepID=A0A2A6C7E6_PRIPA|nr:hypothetical protein PRIPAC_76366 [Pristionchus pacificus]|eukprot:PDM73961.1 hypothetical protein PRIPAC_41317 [Pristionchus pacificus]